MSQDEQDMLDRIKAGNFDLSQIEPGRGVESNSAATITDWNVCYSSDAGQLSGYCTATANPGDTITGLGMVIYSGDGSKMFCVQYTNGLNDAQVTTSIGTQLYTTTMGNNVMCVVYGWTQNSRNFYFNQTMTIGSC